MNRVSGSYAIIRAIQHPLLIVIAVKPDEDKKHKLKKEKGRWAKP